MRLTLLFYCSTKALSSSSQKLPRIFAVVVIASLVCAVNIASRQGFLQYSNSSKD